MGHTPIAAIVQRRLSKNGPQPPDRRSTGRQENAGEAVRRRRRRSRSIEPRSRLILIGVTALVLVGGFIMLLNRADSAAPEREVVRIELPDAFKD